MILLKVMVDNFMVDNYLESVLERVADAAVRESIFDSQFVAREMLVADKPRRGDDKLRSATIEAIAVKGLNPKQNTEAIFRGALKDYLDDDRQSPDQTLPQKFERIVGEVVRAVSEERLLGKKFPQELSL